MIAFLCGFCLAVATPTFAQEAVSDRITEGDVSTASTIRSALLAAGRNALRQGDISNAVFYYSRYLQQKPDDVAVNVEFAGILIKAGRFEEALNACALALNQDPANPEALKFKAIALGGLERTSEALRIIEGLRVRFPEDLELQKVEAGLRAVRGDQLVMRELYEKLLRAGFDTAEDWRTYLQLLAEDRQWRLVIESYELYRDRFPENDPIRFAVIQARLARNEIQEVEALYDAMKSEDLRRDAALLIADGLAASGRIDRAIGFLDTILDMTEPDSDLVAKIALLEAYNRRPLRALNRINAVPQEKVNDTLRISRAKVVWAAGQPGEALAELDRLYLPDKHVEATLARAGLLYDLNREWEIPSLLAGLPLSLKTIDSPDRRLAWCLKILAYIRAGDPESARRFLSAFMDYSDSDLAPYILSVLIEQAARHRTAYDDAVVRLGIRLRDYQPGSELTRPALIKDVPAAAWRVAWNSRPTNPFPLLKLAGACLRERDIEAAAGFYEMGVTREEIKIESLLGLAECARRMRDIGRLESLAEMLRESDLSLSQLITAARLMLRAGMDGMADAFISRIEPEDRDHPDFVAAKAAWLIRGRRMAEAQKLLAEIEPVGPTHIGLLIDQCRGLSALAYGTDDPVYQMARDRALMLAALSSSSGFIEAKLAAADILMQKNEYNKARDLLTQNGLPLDLRVNERLMIVYIQLGMYSEAEAQARRILARRPGDAACRGMLARISVWQSDYRLAWRRYNELISDYPRDDMFALEMEAKRNRALSRLRQSAPLYDEYAARNPQDREMRAEAGDVRLAAGFTKAAADIYRSASWAFPEDSDLRQSLQAAERRSNWGLYADADYRERKGHDRKVNVKQERYEAGARFPKGPDAMTLDIGVGASRFRFDDEQAESLDAKLLAASGRWVFTNGIDIAGSGEVMDYQSIKSSWRADVDLGYRGLDGWKIAVIAGLYDVRDNYYTILDGLKSAWLGAYGQWQPFERLELFGQYRMFAIDAPHDDALLPTNSVSSARVSPNISATTTNLPDPQTWEKNNAHEAVVEASYHLLFFPYNLRVWVNGYLYDTKKENEMYWTPESTFVSGQVGLHWRHTLGRRHFPGSPLFYYGMYAAMGANSEGDASPSLKGELGWRNSGGWEFGAEALRIWGNEYEEAAVGARIKYLF